MEAPSSKCCANGLYCQVRTSPPPAGPVNKDEQDDRGGSTCSSQQQPQPSAYIDLVDVDDHKRRQGEARKQDEDSRLLRDQYESSSRETNKDGGGGDGGDGGCNYRLAGVSQTDKQYQQQQQSRPSTLNCVDPKSRQKRKRRRKRIKREGEGEVKQRPHSINYWHYKETGIKSRPIKLLKHPIEHIERKIILTYSLGFLFKLIAIFTGPIIVLAVYLITVPFVLVRHSIWLLLNLTCTFDARIKTTTEKEDYLQRLRREQKKDDNTCFSWPEKERTKFAKQIYWKYCPLSYIETYWYKEELVNNVILVVDRKDKTRKEFSIDKLRWLVRCSILSKPLFRKFLSRVVTRGIPFYKGYYWYYLGLETSEHDYNGHLGQRGSSINRLATSRHPDNGSSRSNESSFSSGLSSNRDQFSVTSNSHDDSSADYDNDDHDNGHAVDRSGNVCIDMSFSEQAQRDGKLIGNRKVRLSQHIYQDHSLDDCDLNNGSIRRHASRLLGQRLDMTRPLWEIRVIAPKTNNETGAQRAVGGSKLYLIFRCHQSLADGRSLAKILTDHLVESPSLEDDPDNEALKDDNKRVVAEAKGGQHNVLTTMIPVDDITEADEFDEQQSQNEGDDNESSSRDSKRLRGDHNGNLDEETQLRPIKEKRSFVSKVSRANCWRSAVFVGPLTVLLWAIWTFTRRKNNHLNKRMSSPNLKLAPKIGGQKSEVLIGEDRKYHPTVTNPKLREKQQQNYSSDDSADRRFYMNRYNLTKFYRIKQMTRSTVSDVILCALSGALRDYLRKFNGVSNPPNLNISLAVDMRQPGQMGAENTRKGATSNQPTKEASSGSREDRSANEHLEGAGSGWTGAPTANEQRVPVDPAEAPNVNCILVNVPLPTSVEGTVPRLWELRNTMDELRTSADPWVMLGLQRFLFILLPSSWYQWLINYIALRNSSIFVSNIRGPQNMVEAWCVDLLQRAIYEAQQPPRAYHPQSISEDYLESTCKPDKLFEVGTIANESCSSPSRSHLAAGLKANLQPRGPLKAKKSKQKRKGRLRFSPNSGLGGDISAIYYCMQPPTSDIPISFNCITYHDKLFVTVLSRSLLVEDSKLLMRLFFKQLNQLADTIAKRKSLVTIIRQPVPIEISCQPASPVAMDERFQIDQLNDLDLTDQQSAVKVDSKQEATIFERRVSPPICGADKQSISPSPSPPPSLPLPLPLSSPPGHLIQLRGSHKDDIEANVGSASKCQTCKQTVCACRRRKSLFSFDSKQRAVNLLSLLHPSHFIAMRTSRSNESHVDDIQKQLQQQAIECLCGQQLLEELDEEGALLEPGANGNDPDREASSIGSRTPSDDGGRLRSISARTCCAKCRVISGRSTLSLQDAPSTSLVLVGGTTGDDHHHHHHHHYGRQQRRKNWLSNMESDSDQRERNLGYSNPSIGKRLGAHASAQLIVPPQDDKLHSRTHSKSETDLLPANRKMVAKNDQQQVGSKESWLMIGRRSYRKLSVFSKSVSSTGGKQQQQQTSSRNNPSRIQSNNTVSPTSSRKRNLIDTPIEIINRRFGDPSKRRQSVATSTGASHIHHRAIVVKDEINADASLRCQLDTPFLGFRNRRFSTIGSAVVGSQRRASLIPFGLMHNQSFPKLFWDDGEAHL